MLIARARALLVGACASIALTAAAGAQERRAEGTFTGTSLPSERAHPAGDSRLTRLTFEKQYRGALEGRAVGTMLASSLTGGAQPSVALEEVTGTLDGRSGTFVLQHVATTVDGVTSLRITVAPGSGTGELRGLTGTLTVTTGPEGRRYVFTYALPSHDETAY